MLQINHVKKSQKGAVTLLISMMLLIAATLLVLYATQPIIGEQRISANEVRSKKAFQAAQGGIDIAIEKINAATPATFDVATITTNINSAWTPSDSSSYRVRFCNASPFPSGLRCASLASNGLVDNATPTCGTPDSKLNPAWMVSCGWSDDSSARKRIVTYIEMTNPIPGSVNNPMTSGGSSTFSGNSTVVNYFNNTTVWAGGSLNTGTTGRTVIRRPGVTNNLTSDQVATQVGNGNSVCNVNQAPDLICTTTAGTLGPDVIMNDSSLSQLTSDQFFENFLGMTPAVYKSTMPDEIVPGANAGSVTTGGKVYWVDGNGSINQNIGSKADPVVLVVDGDLSISGNATIFGFVFVKGNLTTEGGPLIRGAVFVTGSVTSSGTLNIIYDPDAIAGARNAGKYISSPGSWRDF